MSELRIALVAEGPTDYEVIQAALKAVLPEPFVMTQLQPEATQGMMGTGWCGVLKWIQAAQQRHSGSLDTDPTLVGFDLLIVHLDVDVASKQYADCGTLVADIAQENNWRDLPCAQQCPPISNTVDLLVKAIKSWLGQSTEGDRTIFCLPAQSSGTWLAAAVLPLAHPLLVDSECNLSLESRLGQLPLKERIKKTSREYRLHAPRIVEQWEQVKQVCTQAERFEQLVLAVVEST
ncbi:MAG: hypothetical protein LH660_02740 [Phormidesmis sp. CAN_BIN36]|nr:hypothetical protein [Phormidesmis sp. CAN_BIN36]